MFKTKLKHCDGPCNSDKIIWKNFEGKRYCADCWRIMKPTASLKRSTISKSIKPIPKQSDRRKKETVLYNVARKQFLKDHPICMISIPGVCSHQPANQIHHSESGKDREKYFLDQTTWFSCEHNCHEWIHNNPIQAKELGYLK